MTAAGEGYWARSKALLTRERGWVKLVLVLGLARLVPIVGLLGVQGYALEWARLTAWGADSAPKRQGVRVGACIKTGAKALVIALGYALALGVIRALLRSALSGALGGLLDVLVAAGAVVIIVVAQLRGTIYQAIGAGYNVERVWEMIDRDYRGLARIAGMVLLTGLGIALVGGLLLCAALLSQARPLAALLELLYGRSADDWQLARALLKVLVGMLPLLAVATYVLSVLQSAADLLIAAAVGLWMRRFDVRRWGPSSDPLPQSALGLPAPAADARNSYRPANQSQAMAGEGAAGTWTQADLPQTREVPLTTSPQGSADEGEMPADATPERDVGTPREGEGWIIVPQPVEPQPAEPPAPAEPQPAELPAPVDPQEAELSTQAVEPPVPLEPQPAEPQAVEPPVPLEPPAPAGEPQRLEPAPMLGDTEPPAPSEADPASATDELPEPTCATDELPEPTCAADELPEPTVLAPEASDGLPPEA